MTCVNTLLFPNYIYIFSLSTLTFVWAINGPTTWRLCLPNQRKPRQTVRQNSCWFLFFMQSDKKSLSGHFSQVQKYSFLVGQIPPANPISSFPYLVQSTKLLACQNLNLVSEYFLQFIFGFSVLCTRNPNTSVWVQNLFLSSGDCQEDGCFPDNFDVTTGQNSENPRL